MKLAEALTERAHLQRQLEDARNRLCLSVRYRQGEERLEDPAEILQAIEDKAEALRLLLSRINRTNLNVAAADGRSLTELIAARDACQIRHQAYKAAWEKMSDDPRQSYLESPLRQWAVTPALLRQRLETAARDWHQLNRQIQRLNWEAELVPA